MLDFTKICASNNDFILVDHRKPFITDAAQLAVEMCRRRYSVGADGLILLENSDKADFRMRYLNSDGGEVEMCGNGSRAISIFARKLGIIKKKGKFETPAGIIETDLIAETRVRIKLTEPHSFQDNLTVSLGGQERKAFFINTGVPHVVVEVDDIGKIPVKEWGSSIRYDEQFAPGGANANFIERVKGRYVKIRTYERGVEDETLACGTGSAAAAIIASRIYGIKPPVSMITEGGDELTIHFSEENEKISDVYLEGPVFVVFQGKYPGASDE